MAIVLQQDDRVGPWVCERVDKRWVPGRGKTIGLEKDGVLVAGIMVEDYTGTSCSMHVAGEGNWLTRDFIHFVFGYVFHQMNCNVVVGVLRSGNERAIKFDEKLGFEELVRIDGAHADGALVIMTMRRENCRWINHGH